MTFALFRPMRLALWLALPLSAGAQTPAITDAPLAAPSASTTEPLQGCRPLTDKAIAADMKAVTAQSQKRELSEQAQLIDEAMSLWAQAVSQCEGRAKDRAQRNLADSQKTSNGINEQLGAGPQCASAHKDASALQDLARQALSERRWSDASMLFRKAENMWDMASERCTGSQQEIAARRREQSEIDGQNAEVCAPLFEKAREHTQKLRASAAGLTREDKQDASMVAETLWRDAVDQCKGAAVQDSARNNAQALARERGTPWVARAAPAPQISARPTPLTNPTPSNRNLDATGASASTSKRESDASSNISGGTIAALAATTASRGESTVTTALTEASSTAFAAGTTRYSGQFVRDADSPTYSGSGKLVWANGDVFEGTLVKGQRHGKGLFIWANGQRYNGDWVNDKPIGQASIQFANGNQYEGSVNNGTPHNMGRMRYASGDTYTGQFNAGGPQGKGLYIWKNGQQFDGEWKNERPNGQGKLKFADGNQYEGNVVDGVPNGQGRMTFTTGDTYEGQFAKGEPHGQGSFSWTNGDNYTGLWRAGKKHGQGTFTWNSGDLWEGIYENDEQTDPSKPSAKK